MILLRRGEHRCSIHLSGWRYLSSFNSGMCTFHYAAVAKVEVLINFPGNQMLLLDKYACHSFTRLLCYKGMSSPGKFAADEI